jgi:two-component system, OmpR family, phosphate regulon response regulator OmpR
MDPFASSPGSAPNAAASRPYHLYVVEDDVPLRDMLASYLEKQGLAVTVMGDAEGLLKRIHRLRPDLVILDVGLPGMSGLQACQKLRLEGDRVPIILLTARSEEIDRVMGLEMGADDYLGKPFSARELLARVHAVLRRSATLAIANLDQQAVRFGDTVFMPASRCLRRGDELRMLNTIEYAILAELAANPGIAISRERLLAASHTRNETVLPRTIDTAILRLRRLVEPDPAEPRYIQTVRGHGYMFVPHAAFTR